MGDLIRKESPMIGIFVIVVAAIVIFFIRAIG